MTAQTLDAQAEFDSWIARVIEVFRLNNSTTAALLDLIEMLADQDLTKADMGAVVSDSRKLSDTGAVAFPQDPPADIVETMARQMHDGANKLYIDIGRWPAWDAPHGYHDEAYIDGERNGYRRAAADALDALAAAGLAVVHADVPHGSRAEQVGWWHAGSGFLVRDYPAGLAAHPEYRDEPIRPAVCWVAPSVGPKEQR